MNEQSEKIHTPLELFRNELNEVTVEPSYYYTVIVIICYAGLSFITEEILLQTILLIDKIKIVRAFMDNNYYLILTIFLFLSILPLLYGAYIALKTVLISFKISENRIRFILPKSLISTKKEVNVLPAEIDKYCRFKIFKYKFYFIDVILRNTPKELGMRCITIVKLDSSKESTSFKFIKILKEYSLILKPIMYENI